jgi:ribonuclease P protein component
VSGARFRPHERLRTPAEFDAVFAGRRSASDGGLIVYALPNERAHARIGLSVSRKVGHAPCRSYWRRLLREAFRTQRAQIATGYDFVFVPRPGATPTWESVQASVLRLTELVVRKWLGSRSHGTNAPNDA